LTTTPLGEGLLAVVGPNATVLAADSADGLVLVDGGHAGWSSLLLSTVAERFGAKPVRALFNTHWHPEQTGSNQTLGEQKAEIIAHENTKLWLGTDIWVRWADEKYPPLPKVAWPTTTFYEASEAPSFRFGNRRVECGHMPKAHTDGDIWVFLPEDNVLAAGGFVANGHWPVIDWWTGGWFVGMLDGFDTLMKVANERTRVVPCSGAVMSFADLKAQQQMYLTIFERVQEAFVKAFDIAEMLAAKPTAEFDAKFGDPTQFLTLAYQSFFGHLRDNYDRRLRSGA
jgi:glyoxylase-like metal-dependent hydrolase (beta-lactamase superfamily II)